jgi:hypothetical protein
VVNDEKAEDKACLLPTAVVKTKILIKACLLPTARGKDERTEDKACLSIIPEYFKQGTGKLINIGKMII